MLYGSNYKPLSVYCKSVLILIFLENALRLVFPIGITFVVIIVLILIFLENALRLPIEVQVLYNNISLNPYFFGKCSTATLLAGGAQPGVKS